MSETPKVFPHDAFFKSCMKLPDIYKPLIEEMLPSTIKSTIQFDSITPEPNSFITKRMREKSCDMLFSATTNDNKKAYIFVLCEHQSAPSHWMAQRMLGYTMNIWNKYWNAYVRPLKTLPLVYPIVIYNGTRKYKVSQDIQTLFGRQKEEVEKFFQYKYMLIDLQNASDNAIKEQTYLNFFKYVMKHVHDRDAILSLADKIIKKYIDVIQTTDKKNDYAVTENGLMYLTYSIQDEEKRMEIIEKIKDNIKNNQLNNITNTMKYGFHFVEEKGRKEGKEEGIKEGKEEGIKEGKKEGIKEGIKEGKEEGKHERDIEIVKSMLDQNFTVKQIASILKLAEKEIEKIKKSIK